jgi:RHS repeat-associated protein
MVDYTAAGASGAGTAEVSYYLRDALGSVVALADASGAVVERYWYDPYGTTYIYDAAGTTLRSESLYGNPFAWTGQRYDANVQLYHFRHRTYAPHLGRWLQRDPAGYEDGVNLYEYVLSNPATLFDPFGLEPPNRFRRAQAEIKRFRAFQKKVNNGEFWNLEGERAPILPDIPQRRRFSASHPAYDYRPWGVSVGPYDGESYKDHVVKSQISTIPLVGWLGSATHANEHKEAGDLAGAEQLTTEGAISGFADATMIFGGGFFLSDIVEGGGAQAGKNLLEQCTSSNMLQEEVRFAKSFKALKTQIGSAGEGNVWHHIVEQRAANIGQFGPEAIHNTMNVVAVPREINQALADYYSTKQAFTHGQTVREWLGSQSWREQYDFGRRMLDLAQSSGPLPK